MSKLNLVTDIKGVSVGHATDLALGSGVTAIVFDDLSTASVTVRGGAPAGRNLGMLDLEATYEKVDAIILSGGSGYGLDAGTGAQAALREMGRGMVFAGIVLPVAPVAILFDLLNGGDKDWGRYPPYRELGFDAVMAAAKGSFALGSVGAGTGATTATLKGGLGSASAMTSNGHMVSAVVAVNAVGTATVGDGPHFWAAPFEIDGEFGGLGMPVRFDTRLRTKGGTPPPPATTIGCVVTDVALTKPQCRRLAIMADDGLARAVLPAHAPNDGDTVFAVSTGGRALADPVRELTELGHVAGMVMARAIARGVYAATRLPYPPSLAAWRDRFGG
jgi:L-aminopeptidase/D-esterase-like protein